MTDIAKRPPKSKKTTQRKKSTPKKVTAKKVASATAEAIKAPAHVWVVPGADGAHSVFSSRAAARGMGTPYKYVKA